MTENESEIKQQLGMAWWQPEQWERLKEISEDRDDLDDSYKEWRKNATESIKEIESTGQVVKRVSINLEELILWCNKKGILVNGKARAEYAAYVLQKRHK